MAKKKDNVKDVSPAELKKNLAVLEEHVRVIRFKMDGARAKNVKEVANMKKQIARILTEINKNNKKK